MCLDSVSEVSPQPEGCVDYLFSPTPQEIEATSLVGDRALQHGHVRHYQRAIQEPHISVSEVSPQPEGCVDYLFSPTPQEIEATSLVGDRALQHGHVRHYQRAIQEPHISVSEVSPQPDRRRNFLNT
jgi:hypothetical protein